MIPGDIPQWIVLIWLFTFGAVVGSFLNVCIYRIPQHDHLWTQLTGLTNPPSSCPFCKRRILARDNIPILGWLILWGRCRFCRHSIPPRYALIELFNGLLWVVLYIAIVPAGFSATEAESCLWSPLSPLTGTGIRTGEQFEFLLHAQYFYYLVLVEALLVATFIDFDLQIIPDAATIPAMLIGIVGAVLIGSPHPWPLWFQSTSVLQTLAVGAPLSIPAWQAAHPHLHGLASSLAGIVVGGGVIWILRLVGNWVWQREVMGFGDVILMGLIGSFLGWQPTLLVFFVAPFCGLIATLITCVVRRSFHTGEIPYGPYLSLAALLVILFWRSYFSQFENLFALGPLLLVMALVMVVLLAATLKVVRTIKQWLGFDDFTDGDQSEWRSGDQLAFYANKDCEAGSGAIKPAQWPGTAAGQGRQFVDRWRTGGR